MSYPPSPTAERAPAARLPVGPAFQRPIARLPTAVTAFIGRTLKGPANSATLISNFGEFQQRFGGLWQPAPLGYALEQFFENGGRQAIVVRVVNGARAPSLPLRAGRGVLLLRGRSPGTREYLRASVDYDGIGAAETDLFNLVVQRLRAPGSELIEEQEILRRVSVLPDAARSVARELEHSALVRVAAPLPAQRPDRTAANYPGGVIGYASANADGADGTDLTDYDVIGDEAAGTGLFALRAGPRFDLLCVPPLARERDVGVATLLLAARLCRARQALLIVDPPRAWDSGPVALAGAERWALHSEDALMYFPRLLANDRLRGRPEAFAPGGAAAGLLARADEASPPWSAATGEAPILRAVLRPQLSVDEPLRTRLAQLGVNCLDTARRPPGAVPGARTLVPEHAVRGAGRYLPLRRLTLWLQACILEGTRWTLLEGGGPPLWRRAREQVTAFLADLSEAGAFVGRDHEERFFVICDQRLNQVAGTGTGSLCLLFGFAAYRPGDFQACLVTHEPGGSRVRQVSANRLATMGPRVGEEIETAILRQLVAEP
jgi:phage tail sheath protein FI